MGSRQIVFVCSSVIENKLISKSVEASTQEQAEDLFEDFFKIKPEIILGPFYQKIIKREKIEISGDIQFSGKSIKAYYNNWIVNALILKNPEDCAFLFFDKRKDDKKTPKPVGTVIVKLSDLESIT